MTAPTFQPPLAGAAPHQLVSWEGFLAEVQRVIDAIDTGKADLAALSAAISASAISLTGISGTANEITATFPPALGLSGPANGTRVSLRGNGANTGPVTLNGAPVLDGKGNPLIGGEFTGSTPIDLRYSTASGGQWRIVSATTSYAELIAEVTARQLGQVLRLNNVAGVNAITASLPSAQTLAGLAQDVRLILSPASANTGPVTLDFGFGPHPVTAPEGGPLLPGDLKQGLPVSLRYSTAGGGQWRVVDGVARSRPALVVRRAASVIDIYQHQSGDHYIHLQLTRVPRPERNSDVWRIDRWRHVLATSRTSYAHVADITTQGSEVEQVIYLTGAAEGIGGYIHGNEECTAFSMALDGVPLIADGWSSGRELVMTQTSRGFLPGSTTATKWAPKGPQILTINRVWRVSSYPATVEITNAVTQLAAGHEVHRGYVGMLPMAAAHAESASHWPYLEDLPAIPGPNIVSDAHRMLIWGPDYWGDVQVTEGWDAPAREMRIKLDSTPVGKVYPDAWRGLISTVGGVWSARTVLRLGLSGDRHPGRASPATVADIAALYAQGAAP